MPDTMTSSRAPALISRERSILEFNRRVLAQARRKDIANHVFSGCMAKT